MCGLVGVAGDLTHKEVEAFKDLLYISTFRGWDSTGVAVVSCRGEHDDASYSIAKCLGPAFNLLDSKQLDRALNNTFKKALIGHTRHATVGDSGKVTNAHPFGFKNIVGAHNGTLDYNTRRDIKDFKYFGTDSEALLYSIEEEGVKKTIESQEGAWALTYADMDKKTLHFLRNDQRPLAFCYNKNRDALYWASEPGFLRFVLARKDIEIFEKTVWWCPENLLYSFDLPMKPFGKFEKPKAEKIEGKQKVTHYSSNNNNSSPFAAAADKLFRGRQQGGNANKSASVQKEPSRVIKLMSKHNLSSAEDSDDNCSISLLPKFHEDFYMPYGKARNKDFLLKAYGKLKLGRPGFDQKVKCGCGFCKEVPKWGDNILFCSENVFLCQSCAGDDQITEAVKEGDMAIAAMSANENTEMNDPLPTLN